MNVKRKVVLFLPGFACESWIWEGAAARFSDRFDCVRVDWPLERTPDFHEVGAFADWLEEAHSAELARAAALVGHSMGGLVATAFCARRPGPRLVLVESFPHGISPFFKNLSVEDGSSATHRRLVEMVLRNGSRYSARLRKDLRLRDYTDLAAEYRGPFAGVFGMRASSDEEEVRRALGWSPEVLSRASLRFIPRSAHFPMLENPSECFRALEELLG
ncbi:MAG: alpha/beta hydrolase [Elusimicrobiota bacterium]|jgi:pimeloyl-ACP methyl ester carboxylesterase